MIVIYKISRSRGKQLSRLFEPFRCCSTRACQFLGKMLAHFSSLFYSLFLTACFIIIFINCLHNSNSDKETSTALFHHTNTPVYSCNRNYESNGKRTGVNVAFMGDSRMRQLYKAFIRIIGFGLKPEEYTKQVCNNFYILYSRRSL